MAYQRMERLRRFIEAFAGREAFHGLGVKCKDYGHIQHKVLLLSVWRQGYRGGLGNAVLHCDELKGRNCRGIILERFGMACKHLEEGA